MKLEGKTAVVTGAGSGMGEAIAKLYAKEGANVVVSDMNEETVKSVVDSIENDGGKAIAVVANVTKQEDVDSMIKAAVDNYGALDILVNNAGIMDNFVTVGDFDEDLWDKVIAVNLTAPAKIAHAAIKIMESQDNGGVIINNASVGGLFGTRGGAAYVASKHGLLGLTKNIAATHGTHGKVRCNAIAPGAVATNIGATITSPNELGFKSIQGAGEAPTGQPEEIAQVALFLGSEDSSFVNGVVVTADGGWTAR